MIGVFVTFRYGDNFNEAEAAMKRAIQIDAIRGYAGPRTPGPMGVGQ
jgi:hypothetical protein